MLTRQEGKRSMVGTRRSQSGQGSPFSLTEARARSEDRRVTDRTIWRSMGRAIASHGGDALLSSVLAQPLSRPSFPEALDKMPKKGVAILLPIEGGDNAAPREFFDHQELATEEGTDQICSGGARLASSGCSTGPSWLPSVHG